MPFLIQEAGVNRVAYLMRPKSYLPAYFWDTTRLPENPTYMDYEWVLFKRKAEAKDFAWKGQHLVVEVPENFNPKVYPDYFPEDGYYKGNQWYPNIFKAGKGNFLYVKNKEISYITYTVHPLVNRKISIIVSERKIEATVLQHIVFKGEDYFLVDIPEKRPLLCIWANSNLIELEAL